MFTTHRKEAASLVADGWPKWVQGAHQGDWINVSIAACRRGTVYFIGHFAERTPDHVLQKTQIDDEIVDLSVQFVRFPLRDIMTPFA